MPCSSSLYSVGDLRPILEADEQGIFTDHLDIADQLADRDLVELRNRPAGLFQLGGDGCQSSALPKAYVEADNGCGKCSAGTGQSDRFPLEAL